MTGRPAKQPDVCLIHQGGRLECVIWALITQVARAMCCRSL